LIAAAAQEKNDVDFVVTCILLYLLNAFLCSFSHICRLITKCDIDKTFDVCEFAFNAVTHEQRSSTGGEMAVQLGVKTKSLPNLIQRFSVQTLYNF